MAKPSKKVNELPEPSEILAELGKQSKEIEQPAQEWIEYLQGLHSEIENQLEELDKDEVLEEYVDTE